MGKVFQEIELVNTGDEVLHRHGMLAAEQIRRVKLTALVDTGATLLSVPEDVIQKLGLPLLKQATTRYADGRTERCNIYGPALIRVLGRVETVSVLAGHTGQPALLGQIPLEGLDLLVDTGRQCLVPNPESPDMPLVEVYEAA
jgi:clan AA aspartic protease